jgi:hypothetical protein
MQIECRFEPWAIAANSLTIGDRKVITLEYQVGAGAQFVAQRDRYLDVP